MRAALISTGEEVFGKVVEVEPLDTDRYGRTVGLVRIGHKILNEELIKAGLAWIYIQYSKKPFCTEWKRIKSRARENKASLWSMPGSIPP